MTSVFRIKPPNFQPGVEVAACYVEWEGKYLLLKRSLHSPQGNTWGLPAGKLERGETPRQAVFREVHEETGIRLDEGRLAGHGKLYVRNAHIDFLFHLFHQEFSAPPTLTLSDEHTDHCYSTYSEALKLPLIAGGAETLHHFQILSKRTHLKRKDFYFIRHGETDSNINPDLKLADADLPLNARGRSQAKASRELLSRLPIRTVCFSPISRAKETKEILVNGLASFEMADLSECQARIWTNMVKLEEGSGYLLCPESQGFLARAMRGVQAALEPEGPPLIVAHGGIHWALCYHLKIENHPWRIGNCELVHFRPVGESGWEAEIIV